MDKISSYQVDDGSWIGTYVWRGETYETDETFATSQEAEADAAALLEYLKTHAP